MMIEEKYSELYREWWESRTSEQYELQGLSLDLQYEYFEDMMLEDGSLLNDVIERALNYTDGIFLGLTDANIRFYIVENKGFAGCFYGDERKIEIDRKYITDKKVVLHELIHFFEYQLEKEMNPFIRELLMLELYNKLLPQIDDLRERILNHCELFGYEYTFRTHGEHGVLFFLKSVDLDIRCGYPIGTVCGYGRDEM